ncbi:hypothetical protein [Agrobacterium sp. NPDC090283]|uniref:hypothetical protein n=1 Tax=Agrobacterium sp. NPDC090283 TaxID=3363920 RepID=UPI00383A8F7B
MRIVLIGIPVISLLVVTFLFLHFKMAPPSWETPYSCENRGVLSDNEFVVAAVAQSIRPSTNSQFYKQSSNLRADYVFAEKFIQENPNCCSIYQGDPNDYFSKETFYQHLTRNFAKVVRIKFQKEDVNGGGFFGKSAVYYVKLDECANQID